MKFSRTVIPAPVLAGAAASLLTAAPLSAQTLFSESFDSEASAKVVEVQFGETATTFVDYSNFEVNGVSHTLAEAPNQIEGSAATRGVLFQANHLGPEFGTGITGTVNLYAADGPGGSPIVFDGNYRIMFDMYLSVDPTADALSTGTTEQLVWGLGTDTAIAKGRINRTDAFTVGTWGWLSTEGGYGTDDAVFFIDTVEQADLDNTNDVAVFGEAFPNAAPLPNTPNNQWVAVEITVLGEDVVVKFNGVEFFRLPSSATTGNAFIGYEDPFGSITFSHAYQWGLFDNFVIETASEPTILVDQLTAFPVVNEETTVTAAFEVRNARSDGPLTITAMSFSGADDGSFSAATPLPLVVPASSAAQFEIAFTASGSTGEKSALLEVVSDDPQDPSLFLPLDAIYAPVLLGHYPFDEDAGPTAFDLSGGDYNGRYEERDPIAFGEPGLANGLGTSIRVQEATFSPLGGNFAFLPPLHTPSTSISLWIRPEEDASNTDVLFNRDPGFTGDDRIYGLFIDELGRLIFRSGGIVVVETAEGVIADGETYHVVVTHLDSDGFGNDTADRTRIYVNGLLVGENDGNTTGFDAYPGNASTTSFYVATRSAAGAGYSGRLDDLQIYSIELDAFQVEAMFGDPGSLAPTGPPPEFQITSIAFDDVTGNVTLTWNSRPGQFYTIFKSVDATTWEELTDGLESNGSVTSYVDTEDKSGEPNRFYYVQEE